MSGLEGIKHRISRTSLAKTSLWIFFGLLAYMPLHIIISTWIGSRFGLLELAKIAKDIALIVGVLLVSIAVIDKKWLASLKKDRLMLVIIGYSLLTVLMALIMSTDQDAEVLGVVYNLRFLVFFVYGALLTRLYRPKWLQRNAIRVILGIAFVTLIFGFVQYMWLPDDYLANLGYSRDNGVLPAFFIDDKPDLERIMSTLRDPNSYGSYLIIILSILLSYLLVTKNKDLKQVYGGLLALLIMCLWFTFSRSAWIGAILASLVVFLLVYRKRLNLKMLVPITAVAILMSLGSLYAVRDSYFVKNVILHADESTVLEDPNQLRLRFWQESIESSVSNPLGHGPGTAGLASIRNQEQGTILNENYYLQVLHEVGIVGLGLFMAILAILAYRLYRLAIKDNPLAVALLASFIGLAATNFLVHIWSNEAVAYTWWGLAGIGIMKRK